MTKKRIFGSKKDEEEPHNRKARGVESKAKAVVVPNVPEGEPTTSYENQLPEDTSLLEPTKKPSSSPKPFLTPAEMLKFAYDGLSPVKANQAGFYEKYHWIGETCLWKWNEILREGDWHSPRLCLPPLLLKKEIIEKVPIVIYAERWENEFWIRGAFHPEVPSKVSPLNLLLELSLTFTKKNEEKLIVDRKVIVTMEHGTDLLPLITLYDVPFDLLSSTSPPEATQIYIQNISPDQKWYYWGLAPRFSRDGKFDKIECDSLRGAFVSGREWQKILEGGWPACLCLPPMALKSVTLEDAAVVVIGERFGSDLHFDVKYHPSTPESVKPREMLFKMDIEVKRDMFSTLTRRVENTVTVERYWSNAITFTDLPWSILATSAAPRISVSIGVKKSTWW